MKFQKLRNLVHLGQSYWSNLRYGFPANELKIIAVTGTDGKTTTSTMIYHILKHAGYKTGLITSLSAKIGDRELDTGLHVTTPDPWQVPKLLRMMVEEGIDWVVIEVTSHALDQNRVAFIELEKAVFTNITREHLDYHKTWRDYATTKAMLLDMLKEGNEAIYKEDEKGGKFIGSKIRGHKKVLLPTPCNDKMVENKKSSREGIQFKYEIKDKQYDIEIPILGEFNIANAQCAIKTCENIVKAKTIVEAFKAFKGVLGRMNIVRTSRPCLSIVDFAHTPNALKKALTQCKELLEEEGRLFVIFGCAGLRDKYKRPKMGNIASKYADNVIITAEDPRTENLKMINDEILAGTLNNGLLIRRFKSRRSFNKTKLKNLRLKMKHSDDQKKSSIFVFDEERPTSREDAIELAVKLAEKNDIIIATGKGHERSLCFGTKEYEWSDFDAFKRAFNKRYKKQF